MKKLQFVLIMAIALTAPCFADSPFAIDTESTGEAQAQAQTSVDQTVVDEMKNSVEPRPDPKNLEEEVESYLKTLEFMSRQTENLNFYVQRMETLEKELARLLMNEVNFGVQSFYQKKMEGSSDEELQLTSAWTKEWLDKLKDITLASAQFKKLAVSFEQAVGADQSAEADKPEEPKPQYVISDRGRQQMERVVKHAMANHRGASRGYCFNAVWGYLSKSGYGNIRSWGDLPRMQSGLARYFSDFMNASQGNLNEAGLQRLDKMLQPPIVNPHDKRIPVGAVIVVAAGSTGTSNPVAGDIVIKGNGRFINDGPNMWYGEPGTWRGKLLGVYVPK